MTNPETLTRGEAQLVVSDLKKELLDIKDRIKSKKDILPTAVDELQKREQKIQQKLNDILKKGGLITEEEYNDAYNLIRNTERKELLDLSKKSNRRMIFLGLVIVGVVAYILINKRNKK